MPVSSQRTIYSLVYHRAIQIAEFEPSLLAPRLINNKLFYAVLVIKDLKSSAYCWAVVIQLAWINKLMRRDLKILTLYFISSFMKYNLLINSSR